MNNKTLIRTATFLLIFFLSFESTFAQNYDQLIDEAQNNIQKKNYCEALTKYNQALETQEGTSEKNPYTFYYAAMSASRCNDDNKAIKWLSLAQKNGLGNKLEEINYIETDSAFIKLHNLKEWNEIVNSMKKNVNERKVMTDKLNKEWNTSIRENVVLIKNKKNIGSTSPRFALYFTKVGNLDVPYLVFIPKNYNFKTPSKLIVYLHGGVVSTERFNDDNYQIQQEPIFTIGENLNAIIVYPFGKRDFGWVSQPEAFENIFTIIKQVRNNFKVDEKNIILGGMSNGGTATFYYASQKPNMFKGFFALSSNPSLLSDKIIFGNLSQGKKLITLNSKDDNVYNFKEVENTFIKNKEISKDWDFRSLDEGGHGFMYEGEKGKKILEEIIKSLYEKSGK
ncbi:hypothetical protein [Epilithonimonas hominis]|uniref:hypothetical protein n=1 Tax=Epilithonimonas hominis TaxID=420404 RepID=UPI002896D5C9|nr:hypothetical protein [Epilithonimonas hominis]